MIYLLVGLSIIQSVVVVMQTIALRRQRERISQLELLEQSLTVQLSQEMLRQYEAEPHT